MKIDTKLIDRFLEFFKNQGLSKKTLTNYKYDFMAFYRYLLENKKDTVEQLDKLTIEEYKSFLFSLGGSKYSRYGLQDNLSSGTINKKLVVIKNFLEYINYSYDMGLDYSKVKLNKVKYKRGDHFELEEIRNIYNSVSSIEKYKINQLRLQLIILICFVSGARCSEMLQVTNDGIFEGKQKIMGKGSKERRLFFTEECKKLLSEYLEEQKKIIPRIGKKLERVNDENLAIISHGYSTFGKSLGKQKISESFKKLNNYLNLGKTLTLHTLRHSFATAMVDNGINPFHLKELMGHEKLNTTAVYYHENRKILGGEQKKVFGDVSISGI